MPLQIDLDAQGRALRLVLRAKERRALHIAVEVAKAAAHSLGDENATPLIEPLELLAETYAPTDAAEEKKEEDAPDGNGD